MYPPVSTDFPSKPTMAILERSQDARDYEPRQKLIQEKDSQEQPQTSQLKSERGQSSSDDHQGKSVVHETMDPRMLATAASWIRRKWIRLTGRPLCQRCASINLNGIFNFQVIKFYGAAVQDLGRIKPYRVQL